MPFVVLVPTECILWDPCIEVCTVDSTKNIAEVGIETLACLDFWRGAVRRRRFNIVAIELGRNKHVKNMVKCPIIYS